MIRTLTIAFVLAACGGKQTTPTPTPGESQDTHHETSAEHKDMSPELTKFHDVLAPRWHAEKGPKRMTDTCTAVPEFRADADAIAKATPPTKANADTWTSGTRALVDAVAGLEATCKANDTAKFEQAFHKVHESFHGVMAASGMAEGKAGDHKEHKM